MNQLYSNISFESSGELLDWWFSSQVLNGKAYSVFKRYYANYNEKFDGYLKQA